MKTAVTLNRRMVIRADANARIGAGHLTRCLALAQTWQDGGGQALFLTATPATLLTNELISEGMDVKHVPTLCGTYSDAGYTATIAKEVDACWVVLDGYHFGRDYQQVLKANGCKLLCVDDYAHANHYYADIILNQNLYAHEGLYGNREPYTQLLIGAQYVLLRRQFEKWLQWQREIPSLASKVLVTMGGADPENVTAKVIRTLKRLDLPELQVKVVVGAASPHFEVLKHKVQGSDFDIQILTAVSDMPALMAWADVAVTAGGSTCWEIAYMGLPNCIVVLADNQRPVAEILARTGVSVHLGQFDSLDPNKMLQDIDGLIQDPQRRSAMSVTGRSIISGTGSRNVVQAMMDYLQ